MDSDNPQPLAWFQVWVRAFTRPWPANYRTLIRDPQASPARGYWWIFAASIFACVIWTMLLVYGIERVQPDLFDTSFTLLSIIELTMLGIAVGGIICLVVIINAAIHNQLAYWLGGTGNFDNLTYAQSLALPLVVILVPLYGFPIFYVPLLNIVALKAVHALSWIKAAIPVLITTSLWISLVLWLN